MAKRFLKLVVVGVSGLIIVLGLGVVTIKSYGDANYFMEHHATAPLDLQTADKTIITEPTYLFGVEVPCDYRRIRLDIEVRPGDRVPCVLTQPSEFDGPLPTIILVHGARQSKEFVDRITSPFNKAGFAMISFDQWGEGDRLVEGGWPAQLRAWHDRGWKSVHDTQRIADYLLTRDDVDPERIYIIGASYGSIVATHVLARDDRFRAGVLIVGGGDFRIVFDAPFFREEFPAPLVSLLRPAILWAGGVFDPIHSAPNTGPIPVLALCGKADTIVPPESGKALFEALGDPKEIRWYDIDHPGMRPGDGPEIVRMLDDALVWLAGHAGISKDDLPPPYTSRIATQHEPL